MSLKLHFQNRSQSMKVPEACFNCRNLEPDGYRSGNTYNTRFNCKLDELHRAASNGYNIYSFVQAAIDQIFDTEGQSNIHDLSLVVATLSDSSLGSLLQQFRNDENADRSVFVATKSSMKIYIGISDDPEYRNMINGRTYDFILQGQSCNPDGDIWLNLLFRRWPATAVDPAPQCEAHNPLREHGFKTSG